LQTPSSSDWAGRGETDGRETGDSYRPDAAGRRPIQIAIIRAKKYAFSLRATWVGLSYYAVGCYFPFSVFLHYA